MAKCALSPVTWRQVHAAHALRGERRPRHRGPPAERVPERLLHAGAECRATGVGGTAGEHVGIVGQQLWHEPAAGGQSVHENAPWIDVVVRAQPRDHGEHGGRLAAAARAVGTTEPAPAAVRQALAGGLLRQQQVEAALVGIVAPAGPRVGAGVLCATVQRDDQPCMGWRRRGQLHQHAQRRRVGTEVADFMQLRRLRSQREQQQRRQQPRPAATAVCIPMPAQLGVSRHLVGGFHGHGPY
jgi:hypothetical protein